MLKPVFCDALAGVQNATIAIKIDSPSIRQRRTHPVLMDVFSKSLADRFLSKETIPDYVTISAADARLAEP